MKLLIKVVKMLSKFNSRIPRYNDDSDYTTNAPSYYDDLARKQKLIKELAHKIWEYDQILHAKLKEVEDNLKKYADILDGKIEYFDIIILNKKKISNKICKNDHIYKNKIKENKDNLKKYDDILDRKIEDFDRIILNKTEKWLEDNMENILTEAVKIVWFGLTDDGYFMAVIPENWSDVQFDTTNEGQLMLIN